MNIPDCTKWMHYDVIRVSLPVYISTSLAKIPKMPATIALLSVINEIIPAKKEKHLSLSVDSKATFNVRLFVFS